MSRGSPTMPPADFELPALSRELIAADGWREPGDYVIFDVFPSLRDAVDLLHPWPGQGSA